MYAKEVWNRADKAHIFSEYNSEMRFFLKFIYFCTTLYMFQTGFPSTIRSSKLHIQRLAIVRSLLLPAASRTLYVQFWDPNDGRKNRLKYVERRTEINKSEKSRISLVVLYSANILANVKLHICLISAENGSGWSIHAPITLVSKSSRTKRKFGQPVAKKPIHAPAKHKIPVVPSHPETLT